MADTARVVNGSTAATSSLTWADRLGTVGWAAKGVVYLLLAVIVGQLALGGDTEGEEASKQGALQRLAEQPFGELMLTVVAIGLAAYAVYRVLTVFLPTTGDDDKDKAKHLVRLGSAIVYGALALQAWSLRSGGGGGGSGSGSADAERTWSASLMESTGGRVVLGLVGIVLVGLAVDQARRGITRSFMDRISCRGGWPSSQSVERAGLVGHLARGAVLALLGVFVLIAVWQHDPEEVRSLDEALRSVAQAPAGAAALLLMALGLAAYGLYSIMAARCRRHAEG